MSLLFSTQGGKTDLGLGSFSLRLPALTTKVGWVLERKARGENLWVTPEQSSSGQVGHCDWTVSQSVFYLTGKASHLVLMVEHEP